jgi:hypothetical protein
MMLLRKHSQNGIYRNPQAVTCTHARLTDGMVNNDGDVASKKGARPIGSLLAALWRKCRVRSNDRQTQQRRHDQGQG